MSSNCFCLSSRHYQLDDLHFISCPCAVIKVRPLSTVYDLIYTTHLDKMSEDNLAAVLHGPLDVRFENIAIPEPGQNGKLHIIIFLTFIGLIL